MAIPRDSLIPKLLALIVGLITVVSMAFLSVLIFWERQRLITTLEEQAAATADQLVTTLSFPVWNAIIREIDVQLDWVMMEPAVYGVSLTMKDIVPPVHARSRDASWSPNRASPVIRPNLVAAARSVRYEGKLIAELELWYTKGFIEARIAGEAILFAALVLVEDLTIALGVLLILRSSIFLPLKRLERYAAGIREGAAASIPPFEGARGEIASLHSSIVKMVSLLGDRYAAIVSKEKEKDILVQELFHRTRNALQVIAGLISLRESHVADASSRAMLSNLAKRIRSMAVAQDQLHKLGDLSHIDLAEYLKELLPPAVKGSPIRVNIHATKAMAVIDVAMPLGIALVELESNALEHAFPEGRRGTIDVTLESEDDGCIKVIVGDDGVGPPPGFDPRRDASLGLELVYALIERQLRGHIDFDFTSGFRCTLRFGVECYEGRI